MIKKVFFYYLNQPTIADLKYNLSQYTIHNGTYPDVIEMDFNTLSKFRSLLKDPPKISELMFMDIPIEEAKSV